MSKGLLQIEPGAWAKMVIELDKCILVCANCHGEIHADIIDLAVRVGLEPTTGVSSS